MNHSIKFIRQIFHISKVVDISSLQLSIGKSGGKGVGEGDDCPSL